MKGKKKCSIEYCNSYLIWKSGKCKFHYLQDNPPKPLKKTSKGLNKSYSIKKVSESQKEKNVLKKAKTKELHEFMFEWWNSLGITKRCWACNVVLSTSFSTAYVDHLIPKSLRPDLAFEPKNFFCCCLDCHSLKEMGYPKFKHKVAIEKAKQAFL